VGTTALIILGGVVATVVIVGGLVKLVEKLSAKRSEAETREEITREQAEASAEWRNSLRRRARLRGDALRKRMRDLATGRKS
jgi:hypothetical protein